MFQPSTARQSAAVAVANDEGPRAPSVPAIAEVMPEYLTLSNKRAQFEQRLSRLKREILLIEGGDVPEVLKERRHAEVAALVGKGLARELAADATAVPREAIADHVASLRREAGVLTEAVAALARRIDDARAIASVKIMEETGPAYMAALRDVVVQTVALHQAHRVVAQYHEHFLAQDIYLRDPALAIEQHPHMAAIRSAMPAMPTRTKDFIELAIRRGVVTRDEVSFDEL